ncbi:hypothetical protein TNIN_187591 [Trichonephila inaurata madagascariensis]|uniref:Uncharacterized protein n=1 Tax=Trichonephila inaurata madagascariensis TaxID=2747483 RepID=A0A8X6YYF5_9ARAC|nr:hypothetical protein TNIN_187591 [Trichonephila inaurata madagascariensis]
MVFRFPAEHFNRLLGIMSTVSAVASLLQFPLFLWEASSLQNVLYRLLGSGNDTSFTTGRHTDPKVLPQRKEYFLNNHLLCTLTKFQNIPPKWLTLTFHGLVPTMQTMGLLTHRNMHGLRAKLIG